MASVVETLDIDVPVEHAYRLWSDVTAWPQFLRHVDRVERTGEHTFNWWLSVPGADKFFEAELTEVIPDTRIAWRTVDGVAHAGVVDFHRLSDATSQVTLQIEYEPEGFVERLGAITNLDSVLVNYDLGQFKSVAEQFWSVATHTPDRA
jgi:uncharacterized membrane protein